MYCQNCGGCGDPECCGWCNCWVPEDIDEEDEYDSAGAQAMSEVLSYAARLRMSKRMGGQKRTPTPGELEEPG